METTEADYIVVGGGLTGCVVASRLANSASSPLVVLLEAGPDPTGEPGTDTILAGLALQGGKLDYSYRTEPVAHTANRVHTLPTGRALGGGSILNLGGWSLGDAQDYDEWAQAVGDERWSFNGLKPWLDKTEKHFGVVSISSDPERKYPLRTAVEAAWNELGVQRAGVTGSTAGVDEVKENTRDGVRQPSYAAYPLKKATVLTNTAARRIIFTGTKATAVELDGGRVLKATKEVILCAGAYRTPQIMMLSGIGDSKVLTSHGIPVIQNAPEVGKNLFDHFAVYMAFRLRDPSQNLALGSSGWTNPSLLKSLPYDWVINETVPQDVLAKFAGGLKLTGRNLFEVLAVYVPPGIPGIPMDGSHIATSTMLLLPNTRGTVSIGSSSPDDPPKIQPNHLSEQIDREVLAYAARRTLKVMLDTKSMGQHVEQETPPSGPGLDGLPSLTSDVSDEVLYERIERSGMQHYHAGGTAAMGRVVDAEGRVFGVEGLRIADASVMPVPLGGHPQATLYAMAEQIASFIVPEVSAI
jgi:choline dehydrogenase-like flavoprotein